MEGGGGVRREWMNGVLAASQLHKCHSEAVYLFRLAMPVYRERLSQEPEVSHESLPSPSDLALEMAELMNSLGESLLELKQHEQAEEAFAEAHAQVVNPRSPSGGQRAHLTPLTIPPYIPPHHHTTNSHTIPPHYTTHHHTPHHATTKPPSLHHQISRTIHATTLPHHHTTTQHTTAPPHTIPPCHHATILPCHHTTTSLNNMHLSPLTSTPPHTTPPRTIPQHSTLLSTTLGWAGCMRYGGEGECVGWLSGGEGAGEGRPISRFC